MAKLPAAVVSLAVAALLLTGCAPAAAPPGATTGDVPLSTDDHTTATGPEPGKADYSAGPECDAHAAARNAKYNQYDVQALQASIDDLPFALTNREPVLCVLAMYSLAEPEDRPFTFELAIDIRGDESGMDSFNMSPDLSVSECYEPAYSCFEDTFGNIIVVGTVSASRDMAQYYPNAESMLLVGVQMIDQNSAG